MRKKLCLFVVLAILVFMVPSCDDGDSTAPQTPDISGIWKVQKISISGELKNVVSPDNASYSAITIEIPETTQGYMGGHTFQNTMGFEFKIKEDRQIILKHYGGSRGEEDKWGYAFQDHIMFNVRKFDISKNNELIFMDSQNNPLIVFVKTVALDWEQEN